MNYIYSTNLICIILTCPIKLFTPTCFLFTKSEKNKRLRKVIKKKIITASKHEFHFARGNNITSKFIKFVFLSHDN